MANKQSKLWLQSSLNKLAINRAAEAIVQTGRALPCRVVAVSGSIVTVAFELDSTPWTLPQITIPKQESNWIRNPTQVGDKGVTMPADTHIGNISGLGNSLPKLTAKPSNLSALIFVPISNKNSGPIDQNAAQIQGPNGVILRTTSGTKSDIVTDQAGTTITFGATSITVNATSVIIVAGGKTTTFTSAGMTTDGITFDSHYHNEVQRGIENSGGPAS